MGVSELRNYRDWLLNGAQNQPTYSTVLIIEKEYLGHPGADRHYHYQGKEQNILQIWSEVATEEAKVLDDIISLELYRIIIMNKGETIEVNCEEIPNCVADTWFTVSLKAFVEDLSQKGYELKGIPQTTDLLYNNYPGTIEVTFPRKPKQLKKMT